MFRGVLFPAESDRDFLTNRFNHLPCNVPLRERLNKVLEYEIERLVNEAEKKQKEEEGHQVLEGPARVASISGAGSARDIRLEGQYGTATLLLSAEQASGICVGDECRVAVMFPAKAR